jgi:hypothetical protein
MKIVQILILVVIAILVCVLPVSADSPKLACAGAPKPTVDEAWTRAKSDPHLFALAQQKSIDPILIGAGNIVFDYCWGIEHNYKPNDPRWEREYWVRFNGYAESIDAPSPFADSNQLTFGYRLKMEVIGQLVGLLK